LCVLTIGILILYKIYSLKPQKVLCESFVVTVLIACYLSKNNDLEVLNFLIFNNSLRNDYFGVIAKLVVCFSSAFYFFITANFLKKQRLVIFEYTLVIVFAIIGLIFMCFSNDLLTAYLAVELSSLSFYFIASFRRASIYSIDSGVKYFIVGAISSVFFLLGSSFIYGTGGTINFLDFADLFLLTRKLDFAYPCWMINLLPQSDPKYFFDLKLKRYSYFYPELELNLAELGLSFILISLLIKLALVPFHYWLLDVYEGSPVSSAFFFAVICKLSIFALLIRFFYISFLNLYPSWQFYSLLIGLFSVFVGSFGGLRQRKIKTLLAYSSVTHMGYVLLIFSVNLIFSVQAVFFYLIIYIIGGLSVWLAVLFLNVRKVALCETTKYNNKELGDFTQLKGSNPAISVAFITTMFSAAGVPPLSGFLAKVEVFFYLMKSSFFAVAVFNILFSVISTFYYTRIIKVLYFENIVTGQLYYSINTNKTLMLSLFVFFLVYFFFDPSLLFCFTQKFCYFLLH
jgi:NADH-quinone oxidoreductase subunit N